MARWKSLWRYFFSALRAVLGMGRSWATYDNVGLALELYKIPAAAGPIPVAAICSVRFCHLLTGPVHDLSPAPGPISKPRYAACRTILKELQSGISWMIHCLN